MISSLFAAFLQPPVHSFGWRSVSVGCVQSRYALDDEVRAELDDVCWVSLGASRQRYEIDVPVTAQQVRVGRVAVGVPLRAKVNSADMRNENKAKAYDLFAFRDSCRGHHPKLVLLVKQLSLTKQPEQANLAEV